MTSLVGPRHLMLFVETDDPPLAECSGRLAHKYGVPYCNGNPNGCALHYPSTYTGKHVREPLPVTTGGYGMSPGATGFPLVLVKSTDGTTVSVDPNRRP